jgi:excinuclease ABC subunit B
VVAEQVIRPTGLADPEVIVRPIQGQIPDLLARIAGRVKRGERVLVNTLTKRTSEDLSEYLADKGLKVRYMHSEIEALRRVEILKDLRKGAFDVLVGINLLREGLDLPEVSLVAILDADTTLIRICGRAARNAGGEVVFYADRITGSMKRAMDEMARRRQKQLAHNEENGVTPRTIVRAVQELEEFQYKAKEASLAQMFRESGPGFGRPENLPRLVQDLERQMKEAADALDYELAAAIRDKIFEVREMAVKGGSGRGAADAGRARKRKPERRR